MMIYAIIQEGTEQPDSPGEARGFYQDEQYHDRRVFAEALADQWWIATSRYGLTRPETVIEPYWTYGPHPDGCSFPDGPVDPERWSRDAWLMLHGESGKWFACDELIILADRDYVELLDRDRPVGSSPLESVRTFQNGTEAPEIRTPWVDLTEPADRREWIRNRLDKAGWL